MIDPNKGVSAEVLERLRAESEERLCVQVRSAIEKKMEDYRMTWDDLAKAISREDPSGYSIGGLQLKEAIGDCLGRSTLNDIAHALSAEVYIILRPRYPFVGT